MAPHLLLDPLPHKGQAPARVPDPEVADPAPQLRVDLGDQHLNEDKSRIVDLSRKESFGFLGFDFRRLRSLRGRWRPQYTPKQKKRTALLQELKAVFRRSRSQKNPGQIRDLPRGPSSREGL